jgi:hypothetical protein
MSDRVERLRAPAAAMPPAAMATIWANRRPIRDGPARRNEARCRISQIPSAPTEQSFRERKCAGRGENSNTSIVRSMIGSGSIAAFQSATIEIFSAKKTGLPDRYAGANPKVRSKRLA